jgi:hypothetical protein
LHRMSHAHQDVHIISERFLRTRPVTIKAVQAMLLQLKSDAIHLKSYSRSGS